MFLETTEDNFVQAREALSLFEVISGARLNMEKSIVVPMDNSPPPDWLATTRCKIAQSGEVVRYLGSPIGVQISAHC